MPRIALSFVTVLLSGIFLLAPHAEAADLKNIKVIISDNINIECGEPDGYEPMWGCYSRKLKAGDSEATGYILIRSNLPSTLLPYVFLHNLGHHFIASLSDEQIKEMFNPTPFSRTTTWVRNRAADAFVMWVLGGHVSFTQAEFFKRALLN